ncbi:hypothetical protein CK203_029087 [Vitis vinifera]|uniref:Endonuclease/exonuclease/phosphatase domain-containing protein n=1 Tax=Vitis vinifera TaxID=29760 RepID=A0A438IMQ0_VITVI|nr:hypothetical protein CK203_029087 [Vitis vinifera]
MRVLPTERRGKNSGVEGEVEGDVSTRAGKRVMEVVDGVRLETHLQSANGTREQTGGSGSLWARSRGPIGPLLGDQEGLHGKLGPAGAFRGPDLGVGSNGLDSSPKAGPHPIRPSSSVGPSSLEGLRPVESIRMCGLTGREDCRDPAQSLVGCSGVAWPLVWAGPSHLREPDAEGFPFWDYDGRRRQVEVELFLSEKSRTDCALIEEASRYGCAPIPCEEENASRWDLMEGPSDCKDSCGKELRLAQSMPRDGKGWEKESWPNSGANDSSKRKVIKVMIKSQRVDLFCLQETKIQAMIEGLVRSLGIGRFLNWGTLDAHGSAGGILICWDKRTLEVMEMEVGNFSISCRMRNVEDGLVWMFTKVYGPFSREEREWMWEEIGAIRGIWEDPWCLGGDFNVTLSLRERSNQGRLTSAMRRFAQVVDELELIDLPLQGGVLIWSGGRNNQAWARLDRFLVTQSWPDHFNEVVQCRLPRPTSDHFPIVLMGGGLRRGPSPFRFENMWLKADGFTDLLRSWWQGVEVRGRASVRLAIKMRVLKQKIKVWNREVFGRLEANKNSALQQVEFWDGVERERSLSKGETELKKEAKDSFKKWVLLEETH